MVDFLKRLIINAVGVSALLFLIPAYSLLWLAYLLADFFFEDVEPKS